MRDALEEHGLKVESADLTLVPQNTIPVTDESEAKKILRLMDAIDDHDDVQNVYANFDIADEMLAAYDGSSNSPILSRVQVLASNVCSYSASTPD